MALAKGPRHHSCRPGKRVRVVLKDGTAHVTRFEEKNRKFCITTAGRFPWSKVVKFHIVKESHHGE